jgi:hypothetical protein
MTNGTTVEDRLKPGLNDASESAGEGRGMSRVIPSIHLRDITLTVLTMWARVNLSAPIPFRPMRFGVIDAMSEMRYVLGRWVVRAHRAKEPS